MEPPRRFLRPRFSAYAFHLFSAVALTSVALHSLNQKKTAEAERRNLDAKVSILEDVAVRIRQRDNISVAEVDRLLRLADTHDLESRGSSEKKDESAPSWKEVVLGQPKTSRHEDLELEEIKKQWNLALMTQSTVKSASLSGPPPLIASSHSASIQPSPRSSGSQKATFY